MNKIYSILIFTIFTVTLLQAQSSKPTCFFSKNEENQMILRLKSNLQTIENQGVSNRNAIKYVPVYFHLVANDDGIGRLKPARVLEAMCQLNADFLPSQIQFYLSELPGVGLFDTLINNQNVYEGQSNEFLMNSKRHPNAINVYVVEDCQTSNTPSGGTVLGYYKPNKDWVVMNKSEIGGNASVTANSYFSHEMAHYFSLMHLYAGLEFYSPGLGVPADSSLFELMDGSNCTTTGDYICDTPPDYGFGFLQIGCAPYAGGALDPNGVLIDPMENNMMGSFLGCDFAFTPQQNAVMIADLDSQERDYLDNVFEPVATEITTPLDFLYSPSINDTTAFFDEVTFEWLSVAGATQYIFEVDITAGFSSNQKQTRIVSANSLTLNNLNTDKRYYWRIKPFNEYATCATVSATNSFRTSIVSTSANKEVTKVISWQIQPNPVSNTENVLLKVHAKNTFEGKIEMTDASGRLVFIKNAQFFNAGENTKVLEIGELKNGVYFVTIMSENLKTTQKLVVLK
jgi:Secretion system C-terminal sorting domain